MQMRLVPPDKILRLTAIFLLLLKKNPLKRIFKYRAFGLRIISEMEIPELRPSAFNDHDVEIIMGRVPDSIGEVKGRGVLYEARPDTFLFRLPSVAAYYVENGKSITIERMNDSTDDEVRLFLLGSAFGALIHQRGLLAFHGSTVTKEGKALVIAGTSGAGKSTLAAYLLKKGFSLVGDDISVLDVIDGKPIVYPGIPHLKLWEDVLKKMGQKPEKSLKVRPQLLKYRLPVDQAAEKEEAVSLDKIIILGTKNTEGFEQKEIKGMEKFNLIKDNTYRFQFVDALGTASSHFTLCSKLAAVVRVYSLKRPSTPLMPGELADFVVNSFSPY